MNDPLAVAVDASGNVYIADAGNNLIREVHVATGLITTTAGTLGAAGFSGDGGPATAADLNVPAGLAIDSNGNVYIADSRNHVVRKILAATGTITTIAGNHSAGDSGDSGPATAAELNGPVGLALDSLGDLYIVDRGNAVIRKVDASGTITTFAGSNSVDLNGNGEDSDSEFNEPFALAVDQNGNVYVADAGDNVVDEINPTTGAITTIAGTGDLGFSGDAGSAIAAELSGPSGVAVDQSGNVYIADTGNVRLREVIPTTPSVTISPGTLPAATVGTFYSQQLTASGGSGTGYNFSATGSLDGLTLTKAAC